MPKPVMNIISVASLKTDAREVGCIEILQRGQLILKFAPDRLTPEVVFGLDDKLRGRVKVLSDQTPSLSVRLTEKDGNILQFVKKLLILIKELQNPKK